jgi:hypothetical protein
MAVVLVLAVGFAGLRAATALWASAVFTLTVTLLTTALLGAIASRGRPRIACLGFCISGWVYLLTTFWLWPEPNGVSTPPYLTKALLDALKPVSTSAAAMVVDPGPAGEMRSDPVQCVTTPHPANPNVSNFAPFTGRVVNLLHYRRIGHMLAAVGFGLLGGLLATLFSALNEAGEGRRPRERASE